MKVHSAITGFAWLHTTYAQRLALAQCASPRRIRYHGPVQKVYGKSDPFVQTRRFDMTHIHAIVAYDLGMQLMPAKMFAFAEPEL